MESIIKEHIEMVETMYDNIGTINDIAEVIIRAYRNGNKVLVMGNGGSAVDSEHMVTELVSRFNFDRDGLNAICLASHVATLTAIGNDYHYDEVFSRQVKAYANEGDVVIGISTSGKAKNVQKALDKAIELDCIPIMITGKTFNRDDCLTLNINSTNTARIQEGYLLAIHMICEKVEHEIFG